MKLDWARYFSLGAIMLAMIVIYACGGDGRSGGMNRPYGYPCNPGNGVGADVIRVNDTNWESYAGTNASTRYSPLDQITAANAATLQVAWCWSSPDNDIDYSRVDQSWAHESTPIMVDGVLYNSTSHSRVVAIDAATGATLWTYDPEIHITWPQLPANHGWINRGIAYWRDGADRRIVILAAHGYMIQLDAQTGTPVATFGTDGWVDLAQTLRRPAMHSDSTYSMSSPPMIVNDVIVVGSSVVDWEHLRPMPPGDVRGYNVRTGQLLWTFHTIPADGEPGEETWLNDSNDDNGNANAWAPMSADDATGYVYTPTGSASNNYYGGHRPGDNLYANSLVCLDAATGNIVWHFQLVHHDVWDYDAPAAPNLIDITVDGTPIPAVAQVTKHGFVFVFNRITGAPVWPIEERAVPQSSEIPGEVLSPTQPFPTRPAAVEIQGIADADLNNATPATLAEARQAISLYDTGPLFTPPTRRGTITLPGAGGGPSWSGAAFDPGTGMYYLDTRRYPTIYRVDSPLNLFGFSLYPYDYMGTQRGLALASGAPLLRAPFASLVAIDMNTGEHRWRAALEYAGRAWTLPTPTLLFVLQEGGSGVRPNPTGKFISTLTEINPKLSVYHKATGELLATIPVPANARGAPIMYATGGKQYIVFPVGGSNLSEKLVAVALPGAVVP